MEEKSLNRFLDAQARMYKTALEEIKNGEKETHWIWYIFPQLRGLGRSEMAWFYGIDGCAEARAYLAHPVLSARLLEITKALLMHKGVDIEDIMDEVDAMKLRSSMTLFALISEENSVFHRVLDQFYGGEPDKITLQKAKE